VIRPRGADLIQVISSDTVVIPNYLDGLATGYDDIIQSEISIEIRPAAFGMRMDGAFGAAAKAPSENQSSGKNLIHHKRVSIQVEIHRKRQRICRLPRDV